MKVLVRRRPLKKILQGVQWLFLAAAVLLLGYYGFVTVDAWAFQRRENVALERLLKNQATPRLPAIATSGLIGRIDIQRLGLSVIVVEGITSKALRRAAGHISGTALPGQPGNVGISAHRDTFFRPLRNIKQNDVITLTTLLGEYRYRVVSTKIVGPNDVAVLEPSGQEVLTLVTCYPFYFVGSAPDRFIVRAERIT
jgi:sortase A